MKLLLRLALHIFFRKQQVTVAFPIVPIRILDDYIGASFFLRASDGLAAALGADAGGFRIIGDTFPPIASPDIAHWRGLRVFGRSAVSRRFRGRRDRRGLWRLVRMAMFPALWKVRRKAAAYAAALVNRAWARAHSACQG